MQILLHQALHKYFGGRWELIKKEMWSLGEPIRPDILWFIYVRAVDTQRRSFFWHNYLKTTFGEDEGNDVADKSLGFTNKKRFLAKFGFI